MVTFSSLPLGHSLTDANNKREKKGKQHNQNASFFECRTESLGRLSASWTNNEMIVYIYTRAENSFHSRDPMFICDQCEKVDCVLCKKTRMLIKNCCKCKKNRPVTGVREATRGVNYILEPEI